VKQKTRLPLPLAIDAAILALTTWVNRRALRLDGYGFAAKHALPAVADALPADAGATTTRAAVRAATVHSFLL